MNQANDNASHALRFLYFFYHLNSKSLHLFHILKTIKRDINYQIQQYKTIKTLEKINPKKEED